MVQYPNLVYIYCWQQQVLPDCGSSLHRTWMQRLFLYQSQHSLDSTQPGVNETWGPSPRAPARRDHRRAPARPRGLGAQRRPAVSMASAVSRAGRAAALLATADEPARGRATARDRRKCCCPCACRSPRASNAEDSAVPSAHGAIPRRVFAAGARGCHCSERLRVERAQRNAAPRHAGCRALLLGLRGSSCGRAALAFEPPATHAGGAPSATLRVVTIRHGDNGPHQRGVPRRSWAGARAPLASALAGARGCSASRALARDPAVRSRGLRSVVDKRICSANGLQSAMAPKRTVLCHRWR